MAQPVYTRNANDLKALSQVWLLIGLLALVSFAQTAPRTGSITGRVIAGDGAVVSHARLVAQAMGAKRPVYAPVVSADAAGNFAFHNLEAYSYYIGASLPGYVTANGDTPTRVARLGDHVTVRLTKGAVVSGRVTDADGEPLANAPVSIYRVKDPSGKAAISSFGGTGVIFTDDRGQYRAYNLIGGTYLVAVNGAYGYAGSPYLGNVPIFHPASSRASAAEVRVPPGTEVGGIDIRYRVEPGHAVSGSLLGAVQKPGDHSNVNIRITQAGTQNTIAQTYLVGTRAEYKFELIGIADGEYDVTALRYETAGIGAMSAPHRISIRKADVTGLEIALMPLASLAGKVVIEPLASTKPTDAALCSGSGAGAIQEIVVSAQTLTPRPRNAVIGGMFTGSSAVREDGSFSVFERYAVPHRLRFNLPGERWFLKGIEVEAQKANTPVGENAGLLLLKPGERLSGITVTLAEGAAQVSGKLLGAFSQPMRVHLIPTEATLANVIWRYAESAVRPDGTFALTHLASGKYWLLAQPAPADDAPDGIVRPLAWDMAGRIALRKAAAAKNQIIELAPCMRLSDFQLKP